MILTGSILRDDSCGTEKMVLIVSILRDDSCGTEKMVLSGSIGMIEVEQRKYLHFKGL